MLPGKISNRAHTKLFQDARVKKSAPNPTADLWSNQGYVSVLQKADQGLIL